MLDDQVGPDCKQFETQYGNITVALDMAIKGVTFFCAPPGHPCITLLVDHPTAAASVRYYNGIDEAKASNVAEALQLASSLRTPEHGAATEKECTA